MLSEQHNLSLDLKNELLEECDSCGKFKKGAPSKFIIRIRKLAFTRTSTFYCKIMLNTEFVNCRKTLMSLTYLN